MTGDVSTGSGGGGGVATVGVVTSDGGGGEAGSALAVDVTLETACVTCVVALFAVVVTSSVAELVDGTGAGTAGAAASASTGTPAAVPDSDATGAGVPSWSGAPVSCSA